MVRGAIKVPPFRVFLSSPVDGFVDFRNQIISATRYAECSGKFEFCYFEKSENPRLPGKTICQSIFEATGTHFDAFFIFFGDRVGSGTREEFEYFEQVLLLQNPECQLWWTKVHTEQSLESVTELLGQLHKYNTGLAAVPGEELISSEAILKGRFVAKLFRAVVSIPF